MSYLYPIKSWICPACTFINETNPHICTLCEYEDDNYSFEIPNDVEKNIEQYVAENKNEKLLGVFGKINKICLPVIHCIDEEQVFNNIDIAMRCNCDGIFLVNHDINYVQMIDIIKKVKSIYPNLWVGVNFLDVTPMNIFNILDKYQVNVDGIWTDHYYGKKKYLEYILISMMKYSWKGIYFGAVAFKYRGVCNDITSCCNLVKPYTDVVITSGESTGTPITNEKLDLFCNKEKPIALASGIDIHNCLDYKEKINVYVFNTSVSKDEHNFDEIKLSRLIETIFSN
jgi:uncharacterized protein